MELFFKDFLSELHCSILCKSLWYQLQYHTRGCQTKVHATMWRSCMRHLWPYVYIIFINNPYLHFKLKPDLFCCTPLTRYYHVEVCLQNANSTSVFNRSEWSGHVSRNCHKQSGFPILFHHKCTIRCGTWDSGNWHFTKESLFNYRYFSNT